MKNEGLQGTRCEEIARIVLPGVRAAVAELLSKKGYTEAEIASKLGIAQAAVSKYLSNKYSDKVKRVKQKAIELELCKDVLKYMAESENKIKINNIIDKICADKRLLNV